MIRFEPARATDYQDILRLNEAAVPAVSSIDEPSLAALHRQAEFLTVARSEGTLVGFLLVLDENADYASLNYQYFKRHYDRFLYVDRIVVSEACRGQGVGASLYSALFEAAPDTPRVTCEVNVRPPNPGSLKFHGSLGFKVVGEQDTDGGAKRVALMSCERPGTDQNGFNSNAAETDAAETDAAGTDG